MQNFYRVASKTSSAHLAYQRDLPTLLEMSMTIKEYNLALELSKFRLIDELSHGVATFFLTRVSLLPPKLPRLSRIENFAADPKQFIVYLHAYG